MNNRKLIREMACCLSRTHVRKGCALLAATLMLPRLLHGEEHWALLKYDWRDHDRDRENGASRWGDYDRDKDNGASRWGDHDRDKGDGASGWGDHDRDKDDGTSRWGDRDRDNDKNRPVPVVAETNAEHSALFKENWRDHDRDKDKGASTWGDQNGDNDKNRSIPVANNKPIPVVPETNAGWVLVPFFGAVLVFSSRRLFRAKV